MIKNNTFKKLVSISKRLTSTYAIVLVAAVLFGMVITNPGSKAPFFGLFIFPAIMVMLKPETGIWIILIFVFYINYLADEISLIPGTATWVIEISLITMMLMVLLQQVFDKKKIKKSPVDHLLLLFVAGGLIASFLNHNSLISTFLGCRNLLRMVLLYYCIIHLDLEEGFFKKVINFLFVTALIQGPVSLFQRLIWTPELQMKQDSTAQGFETVGGSDILDFASGTTGTSGITAIYVLGFMCILIAFMLRNKIRFTDIFKFILLFLPIFIGSSRASFLFLPVIIMFMLRRIIFTDLKKGIGIVLVFSIVYIASVKATTFLGYDMEGMLFSPQNEFKDQSHFSGTGHPVGRFSNIMFAMHLMKSKTDYIFGFGPNSVSVSALGSEYSGNILKYLLNEKMVRNATSFVNSQLAFMMFEWGFLGLGLYFLMIVKIYLMNRKFYLAIDDEYWKTISFGFSGIILLYGIASFYKRLWVVEHTSSLFWVMAAIIFSMGRKKSIF